MDNSSINLQKRPGRVYPTRAAAGVIFCCRKYDYVLTRKSKPGDGHLRAFVFTINKMDDYC